MTSNEWDGPPKAKERRTLDRREFVRILAASTAGYGLAAALSGFALTPAQRAEAAEAMVDKMGKLPKRRLGTRMGNMQVTPIVISRDWAPELYGPGLELGMNFIHKAHGWRSLPEALKGVPRESYYTDITVDSTPSHPDDEEGAYRQVTETLQRNGLGYYDIFRAHFGWKTVQDMKEKRGTHRAFARLKKEGKVKYFGVSQHNWVPYPEIIAAQIDEGLIDSMQVFFSYDSKPENAQIFEKAHKAGIGMTAMKVIAQGRKRMESDTARQAALKAPGMVGRACVRHVLNVAGSDGKPIFDCCVSSIHSFEQFEENVGGVAPKVAAVDRFVLV